MELSDADFTKLMTWLGPKALNTHMKYPRGQRFFDTDTRIIRFNIDPNDYFEITPGDASRQRPPKVEGVVRAAFLAMRNVIQTLRARKFKFRIIRVSWDAGGSYIEAILPRPS